MLVNSFDIICKYLCKEKYVIKHEEFLAEKVFIKILIFTHKQIDTYVQFVLKFMYQVLRGNRSDFK